MTRSHNSQASRAARAARRGFTLPDLLVAIAILGFLAAMVLGAVGVARQQSKIQRTQRLINKLNLVVLKQYESYRTRRVPMDLREYVWAHATGNSAIPSDQQYYTISSSSNSTQWAQAIARARVNAIRDLMRLEMPDRWSDVVYGPLVLPNWPSLSLRYKRLHDQSTASTDTVDEWGAAECLYMIVMANPDAAERFHEDEIGDADGDGLPEFHDAWGRPIRFLRWPAGYYHDPNDDYHGQSDIQFGPKTFLSGENPKHQPDPFDPQRVMTSEDGYAMFPLIYSAGPDGQFDINIGKTADGATNPYALGLTTDQDAGNLDPFKKDGGGRQVGHPYNNDGNQDDPDSFYRDLQHYDNVTNHRLKTK